MRLYEAMIKGAKMGPQIYGSKHSGSGTCALGAIEIGLDKPTHSEPLISALSIYAECPACRTNSIANSFSNTLHGTITHLNDQHRWTREAIAEWLKNEVERPQELVERENGTPGVPAKEVMDSIEVAHDMQERI